MPVNTLSVVTVVFHWFQLLMVGFRRTHYSPGIIFLCLYILYYGPQRHAT